VLPVRGRLARGGTYYLIPLVLIVVTVETEQLPVASVRRIVVVVVVFMMDRELTQLFAGKFPPAVRTDPWEHFEGLIAIGSLCHVSLEEDATCDMERFYLKSWIKALLAQINSECPQLCIGLCQSHLR